MLVISWSNFMLDIQQNYLLCGQNQFGCSERIVQAGKVRLRNLRSNQTQQDFTSADGRLSRLNAIPSIQAISCPMVLGLFKPTHPTYSNYIHLARYPNSKVCWLPKPAKPPARPRRRKSHRSQVVALAASEAAGPRGRKSDWHSQVGLEETSKSGLQPLALLWKNIKIMQQKSRQTLAREYKQTSNITRILADLVCWKKAGQTLLIQKLIANILVVIIYEPLCPETHPVRPVQLRWTTLDPAWEWDV